MFQSAIEAATAAASIWTPERPDPVGGRDCCTLCLHRYRRLVLDGPLRQLPHGVAHAAVVVVDDVIAARVDANLERLEWDVWTVLASEQDREAELSRRRREAVGALTMIAITELAVAEPRFDDLRRFFTEPAMAAYLDLHAADEVPWQWEP